MFDFVHSCLTNNFTKLRGVLGCVITFNISLFHHCNCNLTDEAENTLVMRDNNKFCVPLTVEYPCFVINFSFFGCRHVHLSMLIISSLLHEKYVFNLFFFITKPKVQSVKKIKSFKKILFSFVWKDANF